MLPYLATMLALLIVTLCRGKARASGVVTVLMVNWLLQVAMIKATDEQFPWMFFLVVDYISALSVYGISNRRWGWGVIVLYVAQIVCHAAYGIAEYRHGTNLQAAQYHYWWALTYTGWAQLAMVGGWMVHDIVGRRFCARRSVSPASSSADAMLHGKAERP